ncbi:MAG: DUF6580 family putative transport protein [Cyclonatronaceae bacterium]
MFKNRRFIILTALIAGAALIRFLPHPPNFVPIAAMALFGAAFFRDKRMAFLIPISAMLLSDLILGFHSTMLFVYLSFAAIVGLGFLLRNRVNFFTVTGASLGASTLFFLVTNFGAWLGNPMYPQTAEGLIASYVAGIPFFHYTVAGDLFFCGVLFGTWALAARSVPGLELKPAEI